MGQALSRKRTFTPGSSLSPNGEIPSLKTQTNGTTSKETDGNVVVIETTDKSDTSVNANSKVTLSPNTTATSNEADTTVTSDALDTTASANLSTSTVTNEGSPTKKEKRKARKLFTFSLKRSRPGSGRKKSKKENGSTSLASGSDNSKEENRQSLFLEEFEIPECHDTDAVDLSDHEDIANISKNIEPENTSTPKKDESFKKSKKGSKSPKVSKKSKKSKSEKKKKTEEAKAEKKREKEEKAKKEKAERESLKQKKDSMKNKEPVLVVEESVVPLEVQASESQPASPGVTSNQMDNETPGTDTTADVPATEGSITVEVKEESQSPPSSPRSDDDGTPKRVSLGPRLKTAILRKVSSGKESESSRVTLTRPKIVEIPNPPPRKHRKKPASQNADTSVTSEGDTSVSTTMDQSSTINESSTAAETSAEQVAENTSDASTEKQEEVKDESVKTEPEDSAKSVTTEVNRDSEPESPVTQKEWETAESGLAVEQTSLFEIEIKVPAIKESVTTEPDTNQEQGKEADCASPSLRAEDTDLQTNEDSGSRREEETRVQHETVEKDQAVSVETSTDKESHDRNSEFVSTTTIDLVTSSPVTQDSSTTGQQDRDRADEDMRAIAKTHTEMVVNGAVESLKSEAVDKEESCCEQVSDDSPKEEGSSPSQEVIAVNKYSIETGETCTVITVGNKSEISEIKTVDKGPQGEDEHELTTSAKDIADSNTSAINESSDISVDSNACEEQRTITNGSNVCAEHSSTEYDSNEHGKHSSIHNDSNVSTEHACTENDSGVCVDNEITEHASDNNVCAEQSHSENDSNRLCDVSQGDNEGKDSETVHENGGSEQSDEVLTITETITIIELREVHSEPSHEKEANNNKVLSAGSTDKDERKEEPAFKTEVHVVLEVGDTPEVE
ncbi:mucin-22-like [Gigantopelta aegis]|uniref:mucin-22-like n=1 Tax=Gigantopelta aegis TaxID=1735272 RepID=UPI001B88C283|nr:mucin-22-like [Gigantopelta aegis]XP_041352137.1 mucin-22-like [Gigantopelta aegis]